MTDHLTVEAPVPSAVEEREEIARPDPPTATAPRPRGGHSQTLDVLRGLAALGVVVLHGNGLMTKLGLSVPAFHAGEAGVLLFFVLSGYLIGSSVLAPDRFGRRAYVVSRSTRILPNYLLSIALILVLLDASPLVSTHGLLDVGSHVLLIHSMFRDFRTSINSVYWTLGLEWIFYIFMFFLAIQVRHRLGGWCIAIGMILGSVLYKSYVWHLHAAQPIDLNFLYKQFPGTADQFGCGLVVALLLQREATREWVGRGWTRAMGLMISVGSLAALALVYNRLQAEETYYLHQAVFILWPLAFSVAAAGLILFFQQFESEIGPWLRRSGLPLIGVISYSIYLYHRLVLSTFDRAWPGSTSSIPGPAYAIGALAAILAVSAGAYVLIEKPFMAFGRRHARRSSPTRDGRG